MDGSSGTPSGRAFQHTISMRLDNPLNLFYILSSSIINVAVLGSYIGADAESSFRFDDNAAVLLNNKREMLGTRIGGVVSADLRMRGWSKILSLAPKVSV